MVTKPSCAIKPAGACLFAINFYDGCYKILIRQQQSKRFLTTFADFKSLMTKNPVP